jgi:hypothetical protein
MLLKKEKTKKEFFLIKNFPLSPFAAPKMILFSNITIKNIIFLFSMTFTKKYGSARMVYDD